MSKQKIFLALFISLLTVSACKKEKKPEVVTPSAPVVVPEEKYIMTAKLNGQNWSMVKNGWSVSVFGNNLYYFEGKNALSGGEKIEIGVPADTGVYNIGTWPNASAKFIDSAGVQYYANSGTVHILEFDTNNINNSSYKFFKAKFSFVTALTNNKSYTITEGYTKFDPKN